jgi:hypothetical protein
LVVAEKLVVALRVEMKQCHIMQQMPGEELLGLLRVREMVSPQVLAVAACGIRRRNASNADEKVRLP